MSEIIEQIAHCIEFGKINTASPTRRICVDWKVPMN